MGQGVLHRKGQCGLPIADHIHIDARRCAHGTVAPVHCHDQLRREPGAITEPDDAFTIPGQHVGKAGAKAQRNAVAALEGRHQRCIGVHIQEVPAKRAVQDVFRAKFTAVTCAGGPVHRVDNAQPLKRDRLGRKVRPQARHVEQIAGGLQKGRRSQVRAVLLLGDNGGRGAYKRYLATLRSECSSRREASNAAACDQNIGVFTCHATLLRSGSKL